MAFKLLNTVKGIAGDDDEYLQPFAQESLKYIKSAMKALIKDNRLAARYGLSFESAIMLGGIMKRRYHQKMVDSMLDAAGVDELTAITEKIIGKASPLV